MMAQFISFWAVATNTGPLATNTGSQFLLI